MVGEDEEKRKMTHVYSRNRQKKSWLCSRASSVIVKDKRTRWRQQPLRGSFGEAACWRDENQRIDLASCTPPPPQEEKKKHIHLHEFECRPLQGDAEKNQQPLVSITSHTYEVCYTI